MNFSSFVDQAWADHAEKSLQVAASLKEIVPSITKQDQIPALVSLIVHVFGEHLGEWSEGLSLLEKLQAQADSAEQRNTIYRSIAALRLAGGWIENVDDLMNSDQIRVLCVASSALLGQGQVERASKYFSGALELAEEGLGDEDPAHRSLAVTGNNLAAELELRTNRSPLETQLMVSAARAALKHWLIAGQWPEQQKAQYRLSKSLFAAGMNVEALEAAMSCLAICKTHAAGAYDLFWANEAVATVIHATKPSAFIEYLKNMRENFERLKEDEKPWCEPRLKVLEESPA